MGIHLPVDYALVAVEFTVAGGIKPMFTTFGVDPVTLDAQDIAEDVSSALISANWCAAAGMIVGWTAVACHVTLETATGPVSYSDPIGLAGSAGVAGNSAWNNSALLVTKITNRGGRQGRGRSYWPPAAVPESDVDGGGNMGTTTVSGYQVKANALLADLITVDCPMVLLHSSPAIAPDPVTGYLVSNKLATQRTRMR